MPDNWEQNYNDIWYNGSGYSRLDPTDSQNAEIDSDGDTMTNLEEYLYGMNTNGKTLNPRRISTDDDLMNDSYEVQYGLDPLNKNDFDDDPDNDGLINEYEYCLNTTGNPHHEYTLRLDPTNPDTDGDGVKDGMENFTTNNYAGHIFNTSSNVNWHEDLDGDGLINAMDSDSDNDGISDGIELSFYDKPVKIFYVDSEGKNSDTFANVGFRDTNTVGIRGLDPTDSINIKLDTDSDGLPDYKENNATHYFPDYTKQLTEDEIKAQFNAFVMDAIPPRIYNIDIDEAGGTAWFRLPDEPAGVVKDEKWGWKKIIDMPWPSPDVKIPWIKHVWVSVEGDVFDISGVNSVTIIVDHDISQTIVGNGAVDFHFKTTDESLDVLNAVSLERYLLGSYIIEIIADDAAGNIACLEVEQKSIVASLADAFLDLMGDLWNAAVDAALALGSMLYGWIVGEIESKINGLLSSILNMIEEWGKNVASSLNDYFNLLTTNMESYGDIIDILNGESELNEELLPSILDVVDALFGGILNKLDPVLSKIQGVMDFIQPFFDMFSSLISTAQDIVIDIITSTLVSNLPVGEDSKELIKDLMNGDLGIGDLIILALEWLGYEEEGGTKGGVSDSTGSAGEYWVQWCKNLNIDCAQFAVAGTGTALLVLKSMFFTHRRMGYKWIESKPWMKQVKLIFGSDRNIQTKPPIKDTILATIATLLSLLPIMISNMHPSAKIILYSAGILFGGYGIYSTWDTFSHAKTVFPWMKVLNGINMGLCGTGIGLSCAGIHKSSQEF